MLAYSKKRRVIMAELKEDSSNPQIKDVYLVLRRISMYILWSNALLGAVVGLLIAKSF